VRRIECKGPGDRPCPAHAWWYYAGRGRPREFCALCYPAHLAAIRVCGTCGYVRGDTKHDCVARLVRLGAALERLGGSVSSSAAREG
jgi:hypothetical protein